MKPTQVNQLLRPWQTYKNHLLFYGQSKSGSKRHPLTGKQGNKNYYKGTRSSGIGRHTPNGTYTINWEKVRTYVAPAGLANTDLKPYVCITTPATRNTYQGYSKNAVDGHLYLKKIEEFIEYGEVESLEAARDPDTGVERG